MDLRGKKVVVVGLGKSGLSAARLLVSRGAKVAINDRRAEGELGEAGAEARELGAELRPGAHDDAAFKDADLVVVSPGVPPLAALDRAEARGLEVISEIELASRFLRAKVIGVTGTNGKSTVTELLGAMAALDPRPSFVGGNLGVALSEAVGTEAGEEGGLVVVELSSFQLERVRRFRAEVAVLLNVTDDHLDRHGSLEAYAAAKARIFEGQRPEDAAVVPAGDALVEGLAAAGAAGVHRFGEGGEVAVVDGALVDRVSGLRFGLEGLRLEGAHNAQNACAAALAARLAGIGPEAIEGALRSFRGLPHRTEIVRELGGVRFIDDSKATNVGAAVAAIDGLAEGLSRRAGKVVLIAGGLDKGGSYAPLAERLGRLGRGAILIGQAEPLLQEAFASLGLPIERGATIEEAVRRARAIAEPGDVVLLSPACSSYDMFRSYAHRGDAFQEAVRALEEPPGERAEEVRR